MACSLSCLLSLFWPPEKDLQHQVDADGSFCHCSSLLSSFNGTTNNNLLNKLKQDSGLLSSSWHTGKLLYESWKTMRGTTLLGWSKGNLLCSVFLPLIGPTPILRISVALFLWLREPEDRQRPPGWGGCVTWGFAEEVGVGGCGTWYWWVLWTGICYQVVRAGSPSLTLLTSHKAEELNKWKEEKESVAFTCTQGTHRDNSILCVHAHGSSHTWSAGSHKCLDRSFFFFNKAVDLTLKEQTVNI